MLSIEEKIERETSQFLTKLGIGKQEPLAVAFSGGPDSTALLSVFSTLRQTASRTASESCIHAVYVNHNLREPDELDEEVSIVRRTAQKLVVSLHILTCEPGMILKLAADRGRGVEEAARDVRYQAIFRHLKLLQINWIAFAHTFDDQTETTLMRFLQGAGVDGLAGIPAVNRQIIRPFLTFRKSELMQYLKQTGLEWSEDSSNRENRFLRNNLRQLIPAIRMLFPGFEGSLTSMREKMRVLRNHVELKDADFSPSALIRSDSDYLEINIDEFCSLDPYQRQQVLYSAWHCLKGSSADRVLPYRLIRPLLGTASDMTSVKEFFFLNNLQEDGVTGDLASSICSCRCQSKLLFTYAGTGLFTDGKRLLWFIDVVHNRKNKYLKHVRNEATLLPFGFRLIAIQEYGSDSDAIFLDFDALKLPLVVRTCHEGDFIELKEGTKLVSKLLKDWKIPAGRRWMVPLLEDRQGLIAVLGAAYGGRNRLSIQHLSTGIIDKKSMLAVYVTAEQLGRESEYAE